MSFKLRYNDLRLLLTPLNLRLVTFPRDLALKVRHRYSPMAKPMIVMELIDLSPDALGWSLSRVSLVRHHLEALLTLAHQRNKDSITLGNPHTPNIYTDLQRHEMMH